MKNSAVAAELKTKVLKGFVDCLPLRKDSVRAIIRSIIASSQMLERVYIVNDLNDVRKDVLIESHSFIFTACNSKGTPFAHFDGTTFETDSPEYSLALLKTIEHRETPIFIQLNYHQREIECTYCDALEFTKRFFSELDEKLLKESEKNSSLVMKELGLKLLLTYTHNKIDKALDEKNKEDFIAYTNELLERQQELEMLQQKLVQK